MVVAYNQQLVNLRKAKDLSLKQAAKQIGISRIRLFLLENGYFRPHGKPLEKIEKFYETQIDFSDGKDYPGHFPLYRTKKPKSKKRKLLVSGILLGVSLLLIGTGSTLFGVSASNSVSYYGETYALLREKAFKEGKNGRDLVTDLDYYYLNRGSDFGDSQITFFATNSILYFNNSTYAMNGYIKDMDELGAGRFHYLWGGNLGKQSNICTFTPAYTHNSEILLSFTNGPILRSSLVSVHSICNLSESPSTPKSVKILFCVSFV